MLQCHQINTNLYFQFLFCTILPTTGLFLKKRKQWGAVMLCPHFEVFPSLQKKAKSQRLVSTVKTLNDQNHSAQSFFLMLPLLTLDSRPFPKTVAYSISVSSGLSWLGFKSVFNTSTRNFPWVITWTLGCDLWVLPLSTVITKTKQTLSARSRDPI